MSDLTPPGIPPVPEETPYTPPVGQIIPPPPPAGDMALTSSDKTMGMLSHLIALVGFLIPLGSIIGPLVIWLTQKDKSSFVDYHGKESLNFQITIAIAVVACLVLSLLLIGIPLLFAVGIYGLVMTIVAGVKANEGVRYRYPYTLRLIS